MRLLCWIVSDENTVKCLKIKIVKISDCTKNVKVTYCPFKILNKYFSYVMKQKRTSIRPQKNILHDKRVNTNMNV